MERKVSFAPGEFYHIFSRGNNKTKIYLDEADKKRFIRLLYACNSNKRVIYEDIKNIPLPDIKRGKTLVDIGAYCLMNNHFHLLIHAKDETGISVFMGKLLTAYSMYFNKKHDRTGKLFEGAFRSEHVGNNEYLKYLFAYIHLNPVSMIKPDWKEEGIDDMEAVKAPLRAYPYSSYVDYLGESRDELLILTPYAFPAYFAQFSDFEDFMNDWLYYKNDQLAIYPQDIHRQGESLPVEKVGKSVLTDKREVN